MHQYGRHPIYLGEAQSAAMQAGDDEQDQTGGLQEVIEQPAPCTKQYRFETVESKAAVF